MTFVYKICSAADWEAAHTTGLYGGSEVDRRDGFIHLSTAAQLRETARRHFTGQEGLVLVSFESATIGPSLVWEKSRGGDLFPHVYGSIETAKASRAEALPVGGEGPIFPPGIPS